MTYSLQFHEKALKEFRALDAEVRERFKRKLEERLREPHVEADRLSGEPEPLQDQIQASRRAAGL